MWGVPDALLGVPEEFRASRRSRVSAKFHLVKTTSKLYPSMLAVQKLKSASPWIMSNPLPYEPPHPLVIAIWEPIAKVGPSVQGRGAGNDGNDLYSHLNLCNSSSPSFIPILPAFLCAVTAPEEGGPKLFA